MTVIIPIPIGSYVSDLLNHDFSFSFRPKMANMTGILYNKLHMSTYSMIKSMISLYTDNYSYNTIPVSMNIKDSVLKELSK